MEAAAIGVNGDSTRKANLASDELVKKSLMRDTVEVDNAAEQRVESKTQVAGGVIPIAPITPLHVKEVRDIRAPRPIVQRRLAVFEAENSEESKCGSPCTPKQGVLDPFAPGPDDLCLAPKLQKKTGESRVSVARQLDFDSFSSFESNGIIGKMSSDEEKLPDSVCGDVPEANVLIGAELDGAEKVAQNAKSNDGFKTPPPLVPSFDGIGNKCPDAPMKQGTTVSKRLHIDSSLCRKLEF